MAKRQSDTQLTKDEFEAQQGTDHRGGPDRTVDPAKLASSEVMRKRSIKQPKSRFSANTPRPVVPESTFSFESMEQQDGAPTSITNGTSHTTDSESASPFAAIATNGASPTTATAAAAASPTPASPTKPFASLSSTTTPGKPLGGLFSGASGTASATPAPKFQLFGSSTPTTSEALPTEENKRPNPFATLSSPGASLFGAKITSSNMPANPGGFSSIEPNKPKQYTGGLFGSSSTASPSAFSNSTNVFGSQYKVNPSGSTSGPSLFASVNKTNDRGSPAKPLSKPPATFNKPSVASPDVLYPDLASTSTPKPLFPSGSTNNTHASSKTILNFHVPPLPPNIDPAKTEEYEKMYKLRTLNEAFKSSLIGADFLGDFREACNFYIRIAGEILLGQTLSSKRKEGVDVTTKQSEGSPKRVRTEQGITESGGAAKLLEGIIDKNIGIQTPKSLDKNVDVKEEKRHDQGMSNSQPIFKFTPTTTSGKQGTGLLSSSPTNVPSALSGGSSTSIFKTSSIAPASSSQRMSTLFGPGGGPSVCGIPAPGPNDLFSGLKPDITKDPGEDEENSPKKAPSTGLGFFGTSRKEEAPKQGTNLFGVGTNGSVFKPTTGLFGAPKADALSAGTVKPGIWTPGTPVIFGPQSTSSHQFSFNGSTVPTISGGAKLGVNGATLDTINSSYDGITPNTSGVSTAAGTPGPDSDKESVEKSNEPTDDIPTTGDDWSTRNAGEENEDVVHAARAVLYQKTDAKFSKVGVGALRVLKHRETGKRRVILRTEQGRVVLNAFLHKEAQYVVGGQKNTVLIPTFPPGGTVLYIAKLKEISDATRLSEVLESAKSD